jgi:hypothetical protein
MHGARLAEKRWQLVVEGNQNTPHCEDCVAYNLQCSERPIASEVQTGK